jgi:hypothetical protein
MTKEKTATSGPNVLKAERPLKTSSHAAPKQDKYVVKTHPLPDAGRKGMQVSLLSRKMSTAHAYVETLTMNTLNPVA